MNIKTDLAIFVRLYTLIWNERISFYGYKYTEIKNKRNKK